MTRRYTPRISAALWSEARRYWEQTPRCRADDVAHRFGTSRDAVKHRITRERWTRGFTYRMTPVDHLCACCALRASGLSLLVQLDAPLGQQPGVI
jgi:hypothetical protein